MGRVVRSGQEIRQIGADFDAYLPTNHTRRRRCPLVLLRPGRGQIFAEVYSPATASSRTGRARTRSTIILNPAVGGCAEWPNRRIGLLWEQI